MSDLTNVKVGDKLVVNDRFIETVTRTTKTIVYAGNWRFTRSGKHYGSSVIKDLEWYSRAWADVATPELISRAEQLAKDMLAEQQRREQVGFIRSHCARRAIVEQMSDEERSTIAAIVAKYEEQTK